MEKVEKGMWIISPNGQPFKVVGEAEKKLWSGSKVTTPCVIVVGFIDNLAQEVVIQKKDIEHYTDVTASIAAIMEGYKDIAGEEDGAIIQVEKENRVLRIDLDKALEKLGDFKLALNAAQDSIEEKQAIINEFEGSAADIRKAVQNRGVEDIRKSYGGKKEEGDE